MRVEKVCLVCEAVFFLPQCRARKPSYGKYCGAACRQQGRLLKLSSGASARRKYVWEPWMDELMRQHYDSQSTTLDWLETQIPFPRHILAQRAGRLGVARCKDPGWTDAELDYVHTHLGHEALPVMAKKLGRTQVAVCEMAKRRGVSKYTAEGYTARRLFRLLGWHRPRVKRLVDRGWLEASRRQTGYADTRPDAYLITEDALYQCLIAHPELIDLRRVEKDWLLDLLTHGAFTRARLKTVRQTG